MSPQSSISASSQLNHEIVWWTLTLQPERKDFCDAVVGHVVTPLAAQARMWGAERWSYTRSLDSAAPAVRVNVLASTSVVERLQPFARALVDRSVEQLGGLETTEQSAAPVPTRWGTEPVSAQFEFALAKYGGVEGLALAADVCELSSDLAAWALIRFPGINSRSSLAALLLFDSCHAMMCGPKSSAWPDRRGISWDFFWDSHLRSCTGSLGPQAARVRRELITRLAPRIFPAHRLMAATASEPAVQNWRRRWTRAVDGYLYRADKQRVSRSAQHLTMVQSRQLMNRLGLPLRDEAALGLYARSWSLDREADFLQPR